MALLPPSIQERLHRDLHLIVGLLAAWGAATGIVMLADWRTIAAEPAWGPSLFGSPQIIMVYGAIFLGCSPFMLLFVRSQERWRAGVSASLVAGFLSLFLSFTLIIEAVRSKQGWLGAINYLTIAMVLGLVIRSTLRDHSNGEF